jgi:outer membrane protein
MRNSILLLFLIAAAAHGEQAASAFPRPSWFRQHFASPPTRVELQPVRRLSDFVVNGKLELTLKAYIELTLANNTDIALARLTVEMPRNAIQRAFADYDPKLSASFNTQRATQTSISSLEGQSTVRTGYQPFNGTYTQYLRTGTSFTTQFSASRSTSNAAYNIYNPVLSSNVQFSFSQPLLRNRGASLTRMNILAAHSTLRISQYQLRDQLTNYLANAENIYWNVVQARENLSLIRKLMELRAAALDRVQRMADAGAALPLDVYQPKSDYASAQLSVLQAARVLSQYENALRQQIGADLDPAIRHLPVSLTEPLALPIVTLPDKEEAVLTAMKARPDRQVAAAALDADDIGIRIATENLRPSVALTGGYASQGIGGASLRDAIPGGLGDALNQMFHFSFPVYQIGVTMNLPVRDRAASASLADAQIRKKMDSLTLRKQEQTVRMQVLNAIDNLETARASLEQAQLAREFADKRFAAEQKKYELGMSQPYFLLDAQTAFSAAENAVLAEEINYRRNLIDLYRVTGRLLEERGVTAE